MSVATDLWKFWFTATLVAAAAGCGGDDQPSDPLDGGADAADLPDAGSPDADSPDAPPVGAVRVADLVLDAPGATGTGYGDPARAVNGVRGGGSANGSLDVYSLGFGTNSSITLAWSDGVAANGPGDDLAVFENGFVVGDGVFMDLIVVEVSRDGVAWRALAHDYVATDERTYSRDPAHWVGFAGRTPVSLHVENNPVDPFDRLAAGGDGLDLDDVVGDDAESVAIRTDGIRYVRLIAAPVRTNPDTTEPFVHDTFANGADVDGVYARYVAD